MQFRLLDFTGVVFWTVIHGSLPPGLRLKRNGKLSGKPTQIGTFHYTIQALTDTGEIVTRAYTTVVKEKLKILPTTLPTAKINVFYSQQLRLNQKFPSVMWSVLSGSLPPGLRLSDNGLISGTPSIAGTFTFTVRAVATSASGERFLVTRTYTLVVTGKVQTLEIITASFLFDWVITSSHHRVTIG